MHLQIWVKPSAEMQYMYGNHVMKSGLGRITENTPAYTGVVIYSMSDIPLGFGVTAKSTADCRKMDPSGIVVFHQADVGMPLNFTIIFRFRCHFLHHWFDVVDVLLQASTWDQKKRYKLTWFQHPKSCLLFCADAATQVATKWTSSNESHSMLQWRVGVLKSWYIATCFLKFLFSCLCLLCLGISFPGHFDPYC